MPLSEAEFANVDDSELFRAIKSQDWAKTKDLVDEKHASERDRYGNTPLHAAIGFQAPDDILLKLLDAYPEACTVHGTDDWLPLHVAAMWGVSSNVCERLIREYPQALDDTGQDGVKGRTPRHFSGRFSHNKELLERSTEDWVREIERT